MNNTNPKISSTPQPVHSVSNFTDEPFVTAEQASTALNLPLYYFIDARKRAEMGIPFYLISRMVRYRIRELHKWQVGYAARQTGHTSTTRKGGAHA
jgi:hypothetical protein